VDLAKTEVELEDFKVNLEVGQVALGKRQVYLGFHELDLEKR